MEFLALNCASADQTGLLFPGKKAKWQQGRQLQQLVPGVGGDGGSESCTPDPALLLCGSFHSL